MRLTKLVVSSYLIVLSVLTISFATANDICYYAGGAGAERFNTVFELSDSTILLGGSSTDLLWIPSSVPKIELLPIDKTGRAIPPYSSTSAVQNHYAFICRLSKDGSTIQKVYYFPKDLGGTISSIKTNSIPGAATGDIYLCGTNGAPQMIWFGKLDKNIVSGDPTGLAWIYRDVESAKPEPSWDVGGDGKIVYYQNNAGRDWGIICRLLADGSKRDAVEKWYNHALADGGMSISLKPGNGDMRSLTAADYNLITPDGHAGIGKKKGKYPYDYYFKGPKGIDDGAGGFTGYSSDGKIASTVGIAVDRRDNTMYIGFNNGNPQNTHDFETMVMAMKPNGEQLWYSHLYTIWNDIDNDNIVDPAEPYVDANANSKYDKGESFTDSNNNGLRDGDEISQCPPDQYVDDIAIDYSEPVTAPQVVVLARSHGNAPSNYWNGTNAFHNNFTGTNGNEHFSYVGCYKGLDGSFINATWIAEYDPWTKNFGAPYTDPNLDGWPDHNKGWPSLKSTWGRSLKVDINGNIYLAGTGRAPVTTANGYTRLPVLGSGKIGPWSDFARVVKKDMSTLLYSTALTDVYDPVTGNDGGNITITSVFPSLNGILIAGFNKADTLGVALGKGPMHVQNAPSWGADKPQGQNAVFAKLHITTNQSNAIKKQIANKFDFTRSIQLRGNTLVLSGAYHATPVRIKIINGAGQVLFTKERTSQDEQWETISIKKIAAGSSLLFVKVQTIGREYTVPMIQVQ